MLKAKILAATVLTFGVTAISYGAVLPPSDYFFNKKADAIMAQVEGGTASSVKWEVENPSKYNVFATIPVNATATSATYRIYPNGNTESDKTCSAAKKTKPCYEVTVDQLANQGKEVQLVVDSTQAWNFTSKGFVSLSVADSKSGNMLSVGHIRFTELPRTASFSKIANNGAKVANATTLGTEPADWACTKDDKTGLIWEAKPSDTSLISRTYTYSWYNPNKKTNGGFSGYQNLGSCPDGISCDTDGYIKAVNEAKLCGYSDWRLPSVKEYMNIIDPSFIDYTIYSGALDPAYFPATGTFDRYWTAETTDENNTQAKFVILAGTYGYSPKMSGKDLFRVRLVRGK